MIQQLNQQISGIIEKRDYHCWESTYKQGSQIHCSSLVKLYITSTNTSDDANSNTNSNANSDGGGGSGSDGFILRVTNDYQLLDKIPQNNELVHVYIHSNSTVATSSFLTFELNSNIEDDNFTSSDSNSNQNWLVMMISPAWLAVSVALTLLMSVLTILLMVAMLIWKWKRKQRMIMLSDDHYYGWLIIGTNRVKKDGSTMV